MIFFGTEQEHEIFTRQYFNIEYYANNDKFSDEKPMTYGYYQEHKGELLKVETEKFSHRTVEFSTLHIAAAMLITAEPENNGLAFIFN